MWSEFEARDRVRKTSRKSPEFSIEYGLLNPLSDKLLNTAISSYKYCLCGLACRIFKETRSYCPWWMSKFYLAILQFVFPWYQAWYRDKQARVQNLTAWEYFNINLFNFGSASVQLSIFTGLRHRGEDPNQWLFDKSRPVLVANTFDSCFRSH